MPCPYVLRCAAPLQDVALSIHTHLEKLAAQHGDAPSSAPSTSTAPMSAPNGPKRFGEPWSHLAPRVTFCHVQPRIFNRKKKRVVHFDEATAFVVLADRADVLRLLGNQDLRLFPDGVAQVQCGIGREGYLM